MTRKARLWTGMTLFLVLVLNYAGIGIPLMRKSSSIQKRYEAILLNQVKSGKLMMKTEDNYILQVLEKEKSSIDRKALVLNYASASVAILIASWTVFGLVFHRRK